MNPVQRSDSLEGADYTGVLRRRWWIVLAGVLVGVVGAFAYVVIAPKTYTSTAAVYVAATGADQSSLANSRNAGGGVNLDTEAQVVKGGAVAAIAVHLLHSPLTPWALSQQISIVVPPNSEVLNISCSASTATGAAACAQAVATAYLQNRSNNAKAAINAQMPTLQGKIKLEQQTVSSLNTKIAVLPANSAVRIADAAAVHSAQGQLSTLNQRLGTLENLYADNQGGHIITAASAPGKPSSPKKTLVLPSGLAAGLVLGLIAAFVWDRRDKRIHGAQDVERLFGQPVLLDLPGKAFSGRVGLASPRSRTGRAFTELAHAVSAGLGEGSHVLAVAGATPGPSRSVVAANLAATLAMTHSDVVLVCADLNDTVTPEIFGLGKSAGLAEVLAGKATVAEVARGPAEQPGLWVIPPGADPSLAAYHLQHDTAQAITSQLRRDARYIIVEVPTVNDEADTFSLAEFADAALIAVKVPGTRQDEVSDCIQRLQRLRTAVMGVAIVPPLARTVSARPPRPSQQPQLDMWPGEARRNGEAIGHNRGKPAGLTSTSAGAAGSQDRPARARDSYPKPADDPIHGS